MIQEQAAKAPEASTYQYLGLLYQAMDDLETAAGYFDQAIALATELGMPLAEDCRRLRAALLA